jgi:hypothetical protein
MTLVVLSFIPLKGLVLLPLSFFRVLSFIPVEELALLTTPRCDDIIFLSLKIHRNVAL